MDELTFIVMHKAVVFIGVADTLNKERTLLIMLPVEVPDFDSFCDMFASDPYFFGGSTRCTGCKMDRFLTTRWFPISRKSTLSFQMSPIF